jgi:hypothetical protein
MLNPHCQAYFLFAQQEFRNSEKVWDNKKFNFSCTITLSSPLLVRSTRFSSDILFISYKRALVSTVCTAAYVTLTMYSRNNDYHNKPLQTSFYCQVASLYALKSLGLTPEMTAWFWTGADNYRLPTSGFASSVSGSYRAEEGPNPRRPQCTLRVGLNKNLTRRFPFPGVFLWHTPAKLTI